MKKTQFGLLALLLGISLSTSVSAHDSIGFSLNIGRPYYYDSPSVYYAPPPVVYYEPRPIYREFYSPAPYVYYYPRGDRYYGDGWREHHRRHGHREHDDDDD